MESDANEADQTSTLVEGQSSHRLHVIIANTMDESSFESGEIGNFSLYPVVFNTSNSHRSKRQKTPLSFEATDGEEDSLCYKDRETAIQSLKIARYIQKAFTENYLNEV